MPLFDLFWAMTWVFLFMAWLAVIVLVIADVLRRDDLSGLTRAIWVLFVIAIPWLGVLAYVIVAGSGMAQRMVAARAARNAEAVLRGGRTGGSSSTTFESMGGFDTQRGRVMG